MFDFQALNVFIQDELVTDINYNGQTLWIDHLERGRYCLNSFEDKALIEKICFQIANYTNQPFNPSNPILEHEIDNLRISLFHPSICLSGLSLSIRKTLNRLRYNAELLKQQKFASASVIDFLPVLVLQHCNILVSGLPGVGKTELIKYLASFIPASERIITIEDTLEMHYHELFPKKDSLALKVHSDFSYQAAIKASLRQRPDWLCVSEIRGEEVLALMQSVSTGAKLLSTVHADSASQIPKRLLHMFPGNELTNEALLHLIYETIDFGIHLASKIENDKVVRYLAEIVYFEIDENFNCRLHVLYTAKSQKLSLPASLIARFKKESYVSLG